MPELPGKRSELPYTDPGRSPEERARDLLTRLSLPEKVGLMFHTVIEAGPDGTVLAGPGAISKHGTRDTVVGKLINHFNVHALTDPVSAARWHNAVQQLAIEETPHGIPVTISTDPRHGSVTNAGSSWSTPFFSHWPDPLGMAAIGDQDLVRTFGDTVRREYRAVGIRAALHPSADLATEPRWCRQRDTYGQDPHQAGELAAAFLSGLQGPTVTTESVAGTVKHFPGGGPQAGGEDAHFPYGQEQVYPGGRFADHLAPFRRLTDAAAVMPYYGRPVGLELHGEQVESVGFGYSTQIVTDLLRGELGYDGVVLTDWELVNDNWVGDQVLPARAWGVEELTSEQRCERILAAGADQFGGEECVELLLDLVARGRVGEERIDASAHRLLLVKFRLGLFDDPYVDEDVAAMLPRDEDVAAGRRAQSWSTVLLQDRGVLPLVPRSRQRVYLEGVDPGEAARLGEIATRPEDADLALVRLATPYEPRDDLFLEAMFHQGSLEFPPGLVVRMARLARQCPVVIDVDADRAAVVTPLLEHATALTVTFGVSDAAWLDALTGIEPPRGRLPIELPRSMAAVRASREDVPGDTHDPVFRYGFGLDLPGADPKLTRTS